MENRLSRNDPIRKFAFTQEKKLSKQLPIAIKQNLAFGSLNILNDCENKYKQVLGVGNTKSWNIRSHIAVIKKLLPFDVDQGKETNNKKNKSDCKKVYPSDYVSVDIQDTRPFEETTPTRANVLPPIVLPNKNHHRNHVLLEISEGDENEENTNKDVRT